MAREIELLTEIRDFLRVIAEPHLAARDRKLRESLAGIVGKSKAKAGAALLMDGSRTQAAIVKESGTDQGIVSRLTKSFQGAGLISDDAKCPKLVISIPPDFFDSPVNEND